MTRQTSFNPRTRIGCDVPSPNAASFPVFQSTHPHRVRRALDYINGTIRWFQSTHPHRVRLEAAKLDLSYSGFNPRTRIGCDFFLKLYKNQAKFQSTHPHRVRLDGVEYYEIIDSFNPRTRIGCDDNMTKIAPMLKFQSTHPHRVRLIFKYPSVRSRCFNPRTRIGCDRRCRRHNHNQTVSIHAPA